MSEVIIYGAGSLGQVVLEILRSRSYNVIAFIDRDPTKTGETIAGVPVHRHRQDLPDPWRSRRISAIVAIGDNRTRVRMADRLRSANVTLVSAIDPSASIAKSATVGPHAIICSRATVCVHAIIHADCVIRSGAIVEHDNVIERGAFLEPAVRLAGGVTIEQGARVGIGASIIPGRRVGSHAVVEPGAVVIHNVPERTMVGGAPAMAICRSGVLKKDTARLFEKRQITP
ncbi:MAG: NeuD/PglB/VioB family sugar acetyltransferase, partial [Phycisphaerae bacterium]